MRIIKKYKKKIILLVFMCLMFIVQAKAQFFEDDDGPGDFDPPPDNDVPLDTYQWIMLFLALAYGAFIFWKHHKKNKQVKAGERFGALLPGSGSEHCI
jgi:hypothetical protein